MNSLLLATLVCFICLWLCPNSITGKRNKVKCYKAYKKTSTSFACKGRMSGRYTSKDCCGSNGGAAYIKAGSKRRKHKCTPCTTAENWSVWGGWTKCNSDCGPGISRRIRKCLDINNIGCPGSRSEKKRCVNSGRPHCPINGGWSDWGNFTKCSVSCGKGIQLRFRSCTDPKPQHGGKDCAGTREDQQPCEDTPRCPIHGGWGEWGAWSSCSAKCDVGYNTRIRKCDKPKPKFGGQPCDPLKGIEKRSCSTHIDCEDYSGSGASGDFSGSSGDGSGSGSGSGDAVSALDEERNDEDETATTSGSGDEKPTNATTGSDFDFQ